MAFSGVLTVICDRFVIDSAVNAVAISMDIGNRQDGQDDGTERLFVARSLVGD